MWAGDVHVDAHVVDITQARNLDHPRQATIGNRVLDRFASSTGGVLPMLIQAHAEFNHKAFVVFLSGQ